MRRTLIAAMMAVFALACSEAPTSPLLSPVDPRFDVEPQPQPDNPPPPFAIVYGGGDANNELYEFVGHYFQNKPGNVAWLRFVSGTNVVFSPNARIMSVNGNVSGVGTMTVGQQAPVSLSTVTVFSYRAYRSGGGVTFAGRDGAFSGFARTAKGGGDEVCVSCVDGGPYIVTGKNR